jgi:hypothetical protein
MASAKAASIKGVRSPNGSKFKTICTTCNSKVLGGIDHEIANVNNALTLKISDYFNKLNYPYNDITVDIEPLKYARALIGHILSATSIVECLEPQKSSPYFDPLKAFVLGDESALDETHEMYYWFYPYDRHLSAKYVHFHNEGHSTGLSLLSFFPLAFLVTKKNEGIFPAHAHLFDLKSKSLNLSLSSQNIKYADFPFVELKGNQMYALAEYQTIISYPIKKENL